MNNNTETNEETKTQPAPKKGITKIEFIVAGIILMFALLYFLPQMMMKDEKKQDAILRLNAEMFTSKTLERFAALGKKQKPDTVKIANEIIEELNINVKNPIDKKAKAFVSDEPCQGCINVEPDDTMQSIIITGYDKNLKVVVRTVIKPPSFVTYTREDK